MAASSTDFQWYHDADDEHPISQGADAPPANSSSHPPRSSAGPSSRVRQLRGQPKLALKSPSTKAVINIRRNGSRKRRRSDEHNTQPSNRTVTAQGKGKKAAAIPVNPPLEIDHMTVSEDDSSSDDDDDLSIQDKPVSLCCFIRLSTDTVYYRNASEATVSVAKTSAVTTSSLCLIRQNAKEMVYWRKGGGVSSAGAYLISFPQRILIMLYRKNPTLPYGTGFYKASNSTSTLRAHIGRTIEHYNFYREACEHNNIPAVAKRPEAKDGDSVSMQSNISSFLSAPAPPWHREGLISHLCEWIVLDDQVRLSLSMISHMLILVSVVLCC